MAFSAWRTRASAARCAVLVASCWVVVSSRASASSAPRRAPWNYHASAAATAAAPRWV
ncbi:MULTISPECIES: hypothetical protein [Delftia]|uniref:hypothetical protein n=1 Tax=Delftia TaxID=80865 RepID=UPI000305FBC3|nr:MULTISPECIES: hypothetical protein [Delftia]MCP4018119.1 hypothetical protein [Delftia sp.]MCP4529668.1 hypothetical protein [Delftia sp.]QPS74525.1 hypothetical protein I6G48_28585 [Delftia acidovorans]